MISKYDKNNVLKLDKTMNSKFDKKIKFLI